MARHSLDSPSRPAGSADQAIKDAIMEIKRNGSRPSTTGSAEHFTGAVRIDPLFEAPAPAQPEPAALPSSVVGPAVPPPAPPVAPKSGEKPEAARTPVSPSSHAPDDPGPEPVAEVTPQSSPAASGLSRWFLRRAAS